MIDHPLADELRWLDRLLALRTTELSQRLAAAPGSRTQYVSHEEVDWLLANGAEAERAGTQPDPPPQPSPLAALTERFALTPFEERAVVICLAPELDRRYDKLYAYLQDDVARRRPSADLVLELLCPDAADRWAHRAALGPQGTLLRAGILEEVPDPASPSGSSDLARFLRLDPRILDFLLGGTALDARLAGIARLEEPAEGLVDSALRDRVARLVERAPLVIGLHGVDAGSRLDLARAACPRPLLRVDVPALLRRDESLLRVAEREGVLADAVLYLEGAEGLNMEVLSWHGRVVFTAADEPTPRPRDVPFHDVEVPLPGPALREAAWRPHLAPHAAPDAWASDLARRFRLTPDQIRDAVDTAARERDKLDLHDLACAARGQSRHRLGDLAVHLEPRATWSDLILPAERVEQLREVCSQVRFRYDVLDDWGFARKVSRARGVSVLFTGAPGTGKTLAAEVMAGELELDLYKVDLSGVVSKWIGETEKNLNRIFREAEASNAILFFDEADALFGKRTKVADAHDRYANIETSYLLTRMEAHDGVVVLATNLRENIDEAFTRRIRFVVEFPFPDEESRRQIWAGHFPDAAPVDPALDLDLLARELKIAGGSIRNIVLNAAFLAADNGRAIEMEHILHATRREFEKIGKSWGELDDLRPGAR